MTFPSPGLPVSQFRSFFKSSFIALLALGVVSVFAAGCESSTSANEQKETRTFDLVLSSDSATKVGELTTSEITEDDDAFIDEGFFITISLSDTDFSPPYDISMQEGGGICGTFNVQPDEQGEMPCDYQSFLSDPGQLTVTSDNGNGVEANPR